MSVAIVRASSIAGSAFPPSSKSAGHRALICAALAALQNRDTGASCRIARLRETESAVLSDDLNATLGALAALGVSSVWDGDALVLKAGVSPDAPAEVDCVESGSTLRFFLPISPLWGFGPVFRPRPPARPPSRRLCGLPAFTRSRAAIFPGWRQPALVPVRPADRRNLPFARGRVQPIYQRLAAGPSLV